MAIDGLDETKMKRRNALSVQVTLIKPPCRGSRSWLAVIRELFEVKGH